VQFLAACRVLTGGVDRRHGQGEIVNRKSRLIALSAAVLAGAAAPAITHAAIIAGFNGFASDNFGINNAAPTAAQLSSSSVGYSTDGSTFKVTDGGGSEQVSGFYATPVDISSFVETFTYQVPGGSTARSQSALADGFSAIFQNDSRGSAAIGGTGSGKGYTSGTTGYATIANSAAIGYEMYNGQTYTYYQNGNATATSMAPYTSSPASNTSIPILSSGDIIQVTLTYRDNVLNTTFFDTSNKASIYLSQVGVNLPAIVGSTTAYVGFGGGTGGAASTQLVKNFTYTSNIGNLVFNPLAVTGFNQGMIIPASAPQTGARAYITATMDHGTNLSAGGATYYEQGYNSTNLSTGLPASGSTFTSQADLNHSFMMQSYSGSDALLLTNTSSSGTLALATPQSMDAVSVLAAVGNGQAGFLLTVNYLNGTSINVPYDVETPDWFFQGPAAWVSGGRAYPGATGAATTYDNVNGTQPNLYQLDIPLTDTFDPVSSFTFTFDGASSNGGNLSIFAVSAAVPEPASVGLLLAGGAATLIRRRARRA
jgi:hypothetical protein